MSLDSTSLPISQPLQRSLAVVLLAAVVGLIALEIVVPMLDRYAALRSEIAENEAALRRFQQADARLTTLEAEQAALRSAVGTEDGYLKGSNDSLVAAEMQNLIKTITDRAGAQLKSTQILPARDEKGFRKFAAQVEIVADSRSLERAWYEMESGVPYLFIDSFDIEARQEPGKDRTAPPRIALDVRFEVSAYARGAGP